ncbi:MAG: protein kinase [Kofleriaceae bacterium]
MAGGSGSDDPLAETATADGAPAAPATVRPITLGRYRLEHELGSGGMGVVHAAIDLDLERRVAIKLLRSGQGDAARARLLREARAMARLHHPNVVTVYEVGSKDGRDYVAMELVDGGTLADWLRTSSRKPSEILDAFAAAGRGLAAAHAAGLVHRDFKPHNVLRSQRGRILVTDFGLARKSDEQFAVADSDRPSGPIADGTPSPLDGLTATGALVGTPAYMPPEQWKSGAIEPATDQFSFCVALWEALTGQRPFQGETAEELRANIERGPAALDTSRLPRRLRPLLLRGLDPDPAKRWPSMDALLARLRLRRAVLPFALGAIAIAIVASIAIAIVASDSPRSSASSSPTATQDPAIEALRSVYIPVTHRDMVASIRRSDDSHYAISAKARDSLMIDIARFSDGVRIIPTTEDEKMRGFKLFAIRPHSLFATFGFQDTDLIVAIDDIQLTSNDALIEVYKHAKQATQVIIHFERRGEPRTLTITVEP